MSVAPILALRKAIVTHLRADSVVTSTAVSTRIYGEKPPASKQWPFVMFGMSDAVPEDISAPLHVFSKDPFTDDVNAIAEAVGQSLDGAVLTLGDDRKAYLTWAGVRSAGDTDEWHSIVTISAVVPRGCPD